MASKVLTINPQFIVSEGYALGHLVILAKKVDFQKDQEITLEELKKAAEKLKSKLLEATEKETSQEVKEILEVHTMILDDPFLWDSLSSKASHGKITIEDLNNVRDEITEIFLSIDNPLIRERQYDVKDVFTKLLYEVYGREKKMVSSGNIVYLEEIFPSEVVEFKNLGVGAILCKKGSHTSHASILAQSLDIPFIYNVPDLSEYDGKLVFVDAIHGKIIIEPSEEEVKILKELIEKYNKEKTEIEKYSSIKFDDVKVMANIGVLQEIDFAKKKGADGIGLFRTEFLFLNRKSPPSEEEQYLAYKKVLESFYPDEVIIRLLDIGGDKELPYLNVSNEENPFLGVRGVRLLLKNRDLLRTQLRALIRASFYGNLGIMIPMVTIPEDVIEVRKIIREIEEELEKEGIKVGNFKVGIMVEVPSVVFNLDDFIPHIDFVSIGTNDLTQYMFAADRNNQEVSEYYRDEDKVIINAIQLVVNKMLKVGKPVAVCGEIAGKVHMIEKLLDIGLKEFSVAPAKVPRVKKRIYELKTA